MKRIICAVILATLAVPAIAAEEFFVVQDVKTMKCFIIDKPVANAEVKLVGPDEKPYPTRDKAEAALKSVKECARP
jgi:hypothetical protein